MERQAADVLAADLLASSGMKLPASIAEEAAANDLQYAEHVRFPSVVVNDADESQLVAVKAFAGNYPLRGELQLTTLDTPDVPAPMDRPSPGAAWVDVQLKNVLDLKQGDSITLGAREFTVERLILYEPDRGSNVFELAPRVMLGMDDLESAELLGPGSRARFSALMAGERDQLDSMRDWFEEELVEEVWLQSVNDGSPQMQRALNQAQRFLGLASVVTVLLAGAAIALAVRFFALRQADASAVMRTLGASRREVIVWLVLRLSLVAISAALLGIVIGWFAQLVLANLLSEWFELALPAPGLKAPLTGALTAFVALAGFGLLPVIRAGRVSVMRVLQRDYTSMDTSAVLAGLFGIGATFLVVFLLSRDLKLSAIVVLGVVAMLLVFASFGRLIIAGVRRLAGGRYRLAVAGLQRRAGSSVIQLAAFGMGIMALLLIALVRVDILSTWERELPDDAPNVFVVNIQPDQADAFGARLRGQGIETQGIYPMVRARVVAHDGETIESGERGGEGGYRRREHNISSSETLPPSNEIIEGEWWASDGSAPPSLSLEQDFAENNGFEVGDTLTFKAAGVEKEAVIANIRKVDWESFQVNFFILASASALEGLPSTYVTSFHIEEDFASATTGWVREFPGIATLDVGAILGRVKALMDRASMAVEYVFLFTLLAGVCVLLAAVQSSQGERIRESALLRALGASHEQVRRAVLAEFAILGGIAGFLAALFATLVAWGLSRFVFDLPFSFNVWLWLLGFVGGAIGISIAGYLATRSVLHTPPVVALRYGG